MLRLHRFYNSCLEFESWMQDKENILNTFSADPENLGVVQAKFEVFNFSFLSLSMRTFVTPCFSWGSSSLLKRLKSGG